MAMCARAGAVDIERLRHARGAHGRRQRDDGPRDRGRCAVGDCQRSRDSARNASG